MSIDTIFGTTGDVNWLQECARAVLIFIYGWLAVRLLGRRAFGQWSPADIIVVIVTGSTLSRALTGNAPLWGTLAALSVLMALHGAISRAAAHWAPLSRLFEGSAVPLIVRGQKDAKAMRRHGISEEALQQALRIAGIHDATAVVMVLLEPSGKISILKE